jgi:hypothetical protein
MWLDVAQERAAQLDANPNLLVSFETSDARIRDFLSTLK